MKYNNKRLKTDWKLRRYLVLLLVLQNGLQEGAALVARRLLVKHARLDDLLVHVEFVFGSCEDFLLHAVDGAQAKHAHLVLLAYAVSPVLSLKVLESEERREMRPFFCFAHTCQTKKNDNTGG